ncbi:MAG: hypothetical protein JWM73_1728, partial [Solirubrobacterales bacterium]|nr:hypothetical protein [Solirubrobacterales bacterium]
MSSELRVGLDAPLPAELARAGAQVVLVAGWCWAPAGRITGLELVVDGGPQPLLAFAMPRLDLLREQERRGLDAEALSYRSGFWGIASIPPGSGPVRIGVRAALADGTRPEAGLGEIAERAPESPAAVAAPGPAGEPLVAVCMATYDPPGDLLARQLDSIRAQTHRNWVCVISDDHSRPERFAALHDAVAGDPRFVVSRSAKRLGFYRNFERALELAPREAAFVALSDQDDAWHPDKLASLLAAIGDARLAYSDARIVTRDGAVVSETFWTKRRNNTTALFSQLVANAVTGAASLFPRALLDDALPFPPGQWNHFHDHWLGLAALASGDIVYVDRPLYDYVQHHSATIGHEAANQLRPLRERFAGLGRDRRRRVGLWRRHYFADALRLRALAELLTLRLGDRIPRPKRRALARYVAAERSPLAVARLFARGARELAGRPETLGAEWMLGYTYAWRRLVAATARDRPQRT